MGGQGLLIAKHTKHIFSRNLNTSFIPWTFLPYTPAFTTTQCRSLVADVVVVQWWWHTLLFFPPFPLFPFFFFLSLLVSPVTSPFVTQDKSSCLCSLTIGRWGCRPLVSPLFFLLPLWSGRVLPFLQSFTICLPHPATPLSIGFLLFFILSLPFSFCSLSVLYLPASPSPPLLSFRYNKTTTITTTTTTSRIVSQKLSSRKEP